MKKRILLCLAVLLGLTACGALAGCLAPRDGLNQLCADSGLALEDAEITFNEDSHGGFHGDGTRLTVAVFPQAPKAETMKNAGWSPLPMDETAETVVYGDASGTEGEDSPGETRWGSFFPAEDGETPAIPEIARGYWYFRDRHSDTETDFFDRSSFNFTVALYDSDTNTLYYGEADT